MIGGIQNITKIPELKKKIWFSLAMLAVYRIGVHIPSPGIDPVALSAFFKRAQGTLFGLFDMFSGGALENMSVFALGIMPYISASIILDLLTVVIPYLDKLKKEGEAGRKKITQYARYGTVVLSLFQGFGIAVGMENMAGPDGLSVVIHPGWGFRLMTMITLTSGTAFIMWLGEQITERGIGNGISLIIFAGIVARMPTALTNTWQLVRTGEMNLVFAFFLIVLMIAVIGVIVFVERGQRRIPVQYAKRVVGRKMYGGQSTYLPLRINMAGVIPVIFASAILVFPVTLAQMTPWSWAQSAAKAVGPGTGMYLVAEVLLIIAFTYFYTAVQFNPVDQADNLRKYGGYVPGIRPGPPTAQYLDRVLTRLTLPGALFLALVAVLPSIFIRYAGFSQSTSRALGGTSVLIVVGVALDTMRQMEAQMMMRNYEGFLR